MDAVKPYIPVAIGLGILYVAFKYAPVPPAGKAMILGAAGALIASRVPVLNQYVS